MTGEIARTQRRALRLIQKESASEIVEGYTLLLAGVIGGNATALDALGSMFKYGIGVRRDARFAFACYSVAARTYEGAKYNLAAALIEGDGVPKDVRKGLRLMRAGERAGDVDSMNYLGFCYRVGEGVEKDPRKGFALSLKAAKAGLAAAQYDIGMCLLSGTGVEKNSSAAERWISRAARRGDSDAQEYLARRRGRRKPKAGPKTIRSVDKRS